MWLPYQSKWLLQNRAGNRKYYEDLVLLRTTVKCYREMRIHHDIICKHVCVESLPVQFSFENGSVLFISMKSGKRKALFRSSLFFRLLVVYEKQKKPSEWSQASKSERKRKGQQRDQTNFYNKGFAAAVVL